MFNWIKLLLLFVIKLFFLYLIVFSVGLLSPHIHKTTLFNLNYDKTVKVKVKQKDGTKTHGTGYAVKNSKGYKFILTNYHVCEEVSYIGVVTFHGEEIPTKILKTHPTKDLCLLKAVVDLDPVYLTSFDSYPDGLPLYSLGYPAHNPLTINSGSIVGSINAPQTRLSNKKEECESLGGKFIDPKPHDNSPFSSLFDLIFKSECHFNKNIDIQTTISTIEGSSGSPVFGVHGGVVGIIMARNQAFWGIMINSNHIIKFIEEYNGCSC